MYSFILNKEGDPVMKIDTDLKNLILVVAVAVLIPMTVKYGIKAFSPSPRPANHAQTVFYSKLGIGAVCLYAGAKMTPAVMGTGVFIGGLVLLLKGVRCNWPYMDTKTQFFWLLAALCLVYFLIRRKDGGIGGLRKVAARGRKK